MYVCSCLMKKNELVCLSFFPACTSLLSALYSVLRSVVTVAMLYGFCYGALKVIHHSIAF